MIQTICLQVGLLLLVLQLNLIVETQQQAGANEEIESNEKEEPTTTTTTRMTKAQHLDEIILQIDQLHDKYRAAKTVEDVLLLSEDTKLQLTSIGLQLRVFKHFNNIE